MKYRLLGKSGLRVSEASLGTMTFGDEWGWGSSKDEAQKVYETYREAGGNFIDTANFYTNGTSEKFVGEFIKGHRESVVLATKYSNAAPGNDPNAAGNHRKSMMQAAGSQSETIANRLHRPVLGAHLGWDHTRGRSHARSGRYAFAKARFSTSASRTLPLGGSPRQILWRSFEAGHSSSGLQIEYSLIERTVERELIPMAKALNLGVLAWSPLARGVLTGKYHGEGKADGGRMTNEGMKDLPSRGTTRGADHLGGEVGLRTGWSQHGASCTRLAALSNGASNPDHWSAEGISTPGQSRQFGSASSPPNS